jgi:hypothetical protein
MGTKPVMMLAGSFLAAVALAGCQSTRSSYGKADTSAGPATAQNKNWSQAPGATARTGTSGGAYADRGGATANDPMVSQNTKATPAREWGTNAYDKTPAGSYPTTTRAETAKENPIDPPPEPGRQSAGMDRGGRASSFDTGAGRKVPGSSTATENLPASYTHEPAAPKTSLPDAGAKTTSGPRIDGGDMKGDMKQSAVQPPVLPPDGDLPTTTQAPAPSRTGGGTASPGAVTTRMQDNLAPSVPKSPENDQIIPPTNP